MNEKKVTWNDLHSGEPKELKRIYKLNDRQLERAVRRHWDGSNATEKRSLYETVFRKR
jgi:hypothetical protein